MCCTKHYMDFETMENQVETIKYTPEKAKQNGLRTTITTNECLLETAKKLFPTRLSLILKGTRACLMLGIF